MMVQPTSPSQPGPQRKRKAKPILEKGVSDNAETQTNSKFARALGSVDWTTREQGVRALTRFLQRKADIAEGDMLKLWKGLYFCFWHSDKSPVQVDLAERLAAIPWQLSEQAAHLYFKAFIQTMVREWFLIDRLRLDKFLMLVRKFVAQLLTHLRAQNWRPDLVKSYMDVLQSELLLPSGPQRAIGLAYHLCDIFLPELRLVLLSVATPAGASTAAPVQAWSGATLLALLSPFLAAMQRGGEAPIVLRVREGLLEPLVEEAEGAGDEDDEDELHLLSIGEGGLGPTELGALLFDLGAAPDVRARNRKALYDLSQALERAQRKRAKREGKELPALRTYANGPAVPPPVVPATSQDTPAAAPALSKKAKRAAAVAAAAAVGQLVLEAGPTAPAAAPASTKKAKKTAAEAAEREQMVSEADQFAAARDEVMTVEAPVSTKRSRKAAAATPEPAAAPAEVLTTAATPASGKRSKKAAATPEPAAAPADASPTAATPASAKRSKKAASTPEPAALSTQQTVTLPLEASPAVPTSVKHSRKAAGVVGGMQLPVGAVPGPFVQAQLQAAAAGGTTKSALKRSRGGAPVTPVTPAVTPVTPVVTPVGKAGEGQQGAGNATPVPAPASARVLRSPLPGTAGKGAPGSASVPPFDAAASPFPGTSGKGKGKKTPPAAAPSPSQGQGEASAPAFEFLSPHAGPAASTGRGKTTPTALSSPAPVAQLSGKGATAFGSPVFASPAPLTGAAGKVGKGGKGTAAANSNVTPTASPLPKGGAGLQPEVSLCTPLSSKKVRINLKQNLYFAVGGPLPDPLIRTPTRSKGGILKVKTAASATKAARPHALGKSRMAPGSAPAKMQQGGGRAGRAAQRAGGSGGNTPQQGIRVQQSGRVTPTSTIRARASDLFNF